MTDDPSERPPSHPHLVPDLEWREVVPGSKPGERMVRVVRPHVRHFKRVGVHHIIATERLIAPPAGRRGLFARLRRLLIGRPLASAQLAHERISKLQGLAVFASDALSSSAYAIEEVLFVLVLAGAAATGLVVPIAAAIALLLAIVVSSYRQTIRAYPQGGGTYIVTRDNFGPRPALMAASALLIGYLLTVAVSIAAGVAALASAFPSLNPVRVEIAIALIVFMAIVNLRGIRESAMVFALPTYAFIGAMFLLIGTGLVKWLTGQLEPVAPAPADLTLAAEPLAVFLVLRAFASGCTALTGTEAIADGVGAFKEPTWKNAGRTLVAMAAILAVLVLGVAFLAQQLGVVPRADETVVSQIARAVFAEGALYYGVQFATMLILILAANTAFADFPRLSYFLARDRFMPHQFLFRGERLAFSTGILSLAVLAGLLVIAFDADVHALLPLYAVGVFVAFTFSQAGMIRRWWRERASGWQRSMALNTVGAITTGTVAAVITVTRFTQGAWAVLVLVPLFVLLLTSIKQHYQKVSDELRLRPHDDRPQPHEQPVIVPISGLHRGTANAIAYARSISSNVAAVFVTDDVEEAKRLQDEWEQWQFAIPLVILESPYRALVGPLIAYIDALDQQDPESPITVVLPEFVPKHWWGYLLHNQDALRLKLALFFRPNTVVVDVPYHLGC